MSPSSSSRVGGGQGGGSSVYLLNCSVCKGEFSSRQKWGEHLIMDGHQNMARECLQRDPDNLRDCSLVVFTTYDVTVEWAGKIIQYFGTDQTTWVTDFLWWEDRPRFAVVQFESRKKVEKVLSEFESMSGGIIQIENQGIQAKGAFDLLELEWKAISPGSNPAPLTSPLTSPKSFQKLAEESESTRTDKHHRLSNSTTEEVEGDVTEAEENLGEEPDSTNFVKLLFDLAEERQWKPPEFKFEELNNAINKKPKYICTVLLNGQVYKPHWFTGRAKTAEEAKEKASKFCLRALNSSEEAESEDKNQKEDQDGSVGTLLALCQKLYGKYPEFKVEKLGRRCYCRVILNGVIYKPPRSTFKVDTSDEAKLKTSRFCIENIEKEYGISAQEYLSSPPPPSHLSDQFIVISQFVEIPDEKYKEINEIVSSFRAVLRKQVPSTQVTIFRNWYLKLRNSPTDTDEPLFIYIYDENGITDSDASTSQDNFTWIPGRLVQNAISQFNELFDRLENTFPYPDDPNETRLGCKFLHKPSGLPFIVVNFKRTMVEVQISRLVKYFCEFDPRIRPLLILARYWVITNGIHWGEPEVTGRTSHQCLPEPHPLDWMILTFLMGEKYVPSLRSVLERPHKPILEARHRIDVGFSADGDFAREWKKEKGVKAEPSEHLNLSTLLIFQNFLEFCCTQIFEKGGVIINPKDGEVLETSKFLRGDFTSSLTPEEISVLKEFQENSDNDNRGKYCVNFSRWNWYMINPLITNWRFSVPVRKEELTTIQSTRKTSERLKNLLKLIESEGAEKAFEICGATLCEILKVDKEIPGIDPRPSRKRRLDNCQVGMEYEHLEKETEEEGPPKIKKIRREPGPAIVTFDLENLPPQSKGTLPYQLYILLEESVVIPDNQFDKVLQAVNFLQKVFFHSNDPTCKVSLFRSWNLKLKTVQDDLGDMPLVYVYNRKPCAETDSGLTLLPSGKIWSMLKSREVKKKISVLEGPTPKGKDPSTFKKGWTLECKGFGVDGNNDKETFKLCLFSSHKFLFEVETGNLLEYMCKFDGRAYQLIKLAYFWMGVNGLTLGEVGEEDGGLSSLQWLVIFWMCHRKMVPSPRKIQGRGNHKVMRDGGTGVDLGWEEDKSFLEEWREERKEEEFEWREECVVGLLEGFREFLEFCGWLGEGSGASWILNTKNGELIEMKKFLDSEYSGGDWDKSMSGEEIGLLRAQVLNVKECKVYMTHPFNLLWRFGLRNDIGFVLKLMKTGGIRLRKYLNVSKSNGEKATKKRFKSLKNVFTLTDVKSK